MRQQKFLRLALCICLLILCGALGLTAHFWKESQETQAQLAAARERNQVLEEELHQRSVQFAQAQADRMEAEQKRDDAVLRNERASRRDNPIDQYYFSDKRMVGSSTVEMGVNAAFYREAWKQELDHAVAWVKSVSEYKEDHQLLENYRALIERQANKAYDIMLFRGAGDYPPRDEREVNRLFILGTNGSVGSTRAEAEVYRQGTLWLLDTYCYALDYHISGYSFGFDDDFIIERYGMDDLMFPPLSQVLPGLS